MNTPPSPKIVLIISTITSFMTAFMGSSLNIALPIMGKDFAASAIFLSWISTIYLLTTAALLLPAGRLSDIKGRTYFFKAGIILFTAGSFLCGTAPGDFILFSGRIIQGIGGAFIFSCSTAMLVSVYPLKERGRVLGITVAAVYTGLSSGPFLGGIITQHLGWRWIFLINSVFGILVALAAFAFLRKEWEENLNEKFDLTGAVIYSLSIIVIMTGVSFIPQITGYFVVTAGLILLILFYFIETKKSAPLLDVVLFGTNRAFALSNLAALINYSATFAIGFLLSFFLQSVKGLTPQSAGLILITQPVIQALFSPLAGRLSDRYEPRIVSSMGMGVLTLGLLILCFINPNFSYHLIIGTLAFLGLGFALFSSPNVNAVMSSVEKRFYGVASSALASMRMIGQMLSMGLVIVIFTVFLGKAKISYENRFIFLDSARTAFIIFSVLSFAGIFASLSRGNIHNEKEK